jgi:hypothetical protein
MILVYFLLLHFSTLPFILCITFYLCERRRTAPKHTRIVTSDSAYRYPRLLTPLITCDSANRTKPRHYATLPAMECSWLHTLFLQSVPVVRLHRVFAICQPSLSCELSGFPFVPSHLETSDHFEIMINYRVPIDNYFYWSLWWTKWHWDRLFSQYFSFPLSVSFHHCSIPIHPSTTHAV